MESVSTCGVTTNPFSANTVSTICRIRMSGVNSASGNCAASAQVTVADWATSWSSDTSSMYRSW